MFSGIFSVLLMIFILIFREWILTALFGKTEPAVRNACMIYLKITAYSLPWLAIYDAGAALCRSIGRTGATMRISLAANLINIIGNGIGVFVFHLGAAGVAWPSLVARILSAVAVTAFCFRRKNQIVYEWKHIFTWKPDLLERIMKIAVPNGLENGTHQLVKVALSSMVALFGTSQIAANGVAQSIWSLVAIMGLAMAPVYTTVIGQCMGAGDVKAAEFYFRKLNKIAFCMSVFWNGLIFGIAPLLISRSVLSAETKKLIIILVLINNIFNGFFYPFAGPLGSGLRAAGDIKYTMLVSITLTIGARLFFAVLFGIGLKWGVIGVAVGMSMELMFRDLLFLRRYYSRKWTEFKLI